MQAVTHVIQPDMAKGFRLFELVGMAPHPGKTSTSHANIDGSVVTHNSHISGEDQLQLLPTGQEELE